MQCRATCRPVPDNFLAVWFAWRTDPARSKILHFESPLASNFNLSALHDAAARNPQWAPLAHELSAACWGLVPGVHRIALDQGRVLLTLHCGVPFAPAPATHAVEPAVTPGRCVVIGGGVSGASVAASLARRGWAVQVLDAAPQPAAGASGLPVAVFAPHVSPDDSLLSRLTRAGIRATLSSAAPCLKGGFDGAATGVLERGIKNARRLPPEFMPSAQNPLAAGTDWSRTADAAQRQAAQVPDGEPTLWHARAGWLRPALWVAVLLDHPAIAWHGGTTVDHVVRHNGLWQVLSAAGDVLAQADLVVVACAHASTRMLGDALPLQALRGQISLGTLPDDDQALAPRHPLNGHGSVVVARNAQGHWQWAVGSTFQRGRTDTAVDPADHADNLARLDQLTPQLSGAAHAALAQGKVTGWAGVRATLPDRLPAVGPIDPAGQPGLWACTGMGARGMTFAALCGELLASKLHAEPLPVEPALANALAADRFRRRRPEYRRSASS